MALNATTVSANITLSQTSFGIGSSTGVTAPNYTTGSNVTYGLCENEWMLVTGITGTTVSVVRGYFGSQAQAHNSSAPIVFGLVTDFPIIVPAIASFVTANSGLQNRYQGVYAPVTAAGTITPTGPIFHITGTTATSVINLPTNFVEGSITVIADAIWTFTSTTAAQGIAQAGTVTSLGSTVTFTYDAKTALWYPSRLA